MIDMTPTAFASVEEGIEEIRAGRMVVVVDAADRENEGDLTIAAQFATPEAIAFMAKEGRGLICLCLTGERCDELGLRMMTERNETPYGTAFTVSVEAREGISTGISAQDRARTIQVAIDPSKDGGDLVQPGHVFPLRARPGGVGRLRCRPVQGVADRQAARRARARRRRRRRERARARALGVPDGRRLPLAALRLRRAARRGDEAHLRRAARRPPVHGAG